MHKCFALARILTFGPLLNNVTLEASRISKRYTGLSAERLSSLPSNHAKKPLTIQQVEYKLEQTWTVLLQEFTTTCVTHDWEKITTKDFHIERKAEAEAMGRGCYSFKKLVYVCCNCSIIFPSQSHPIEQKGSFYCFLYTIVFRTSIKNKAIHQEWKRGKAHNNRMGQ